MSYGPGRWGASPKKGAISFPSPASPRTQRRWHDPDGFHKDARTFKEQRGGAKDDRKRPQESAKDDARAARGACERVGIGPH